MPSVIEDDPTPSSPLEEEEGGDGEDPEEEDDEENESAQASPAAGGAPDEEDDDGEEEEDLDENDNDSRNDEEDNLDNVKEEEGEDDDNDNHREIMVGGKIDIEAFALIAGVFIQGDPHDPENRQVLSIPITRLPATLGRSHDSKDKNFFGLGTKKVLSRQQAMIYYRDRAGGRLDQSNGSQKLVYIPSKGTPTSVIHKDEKTLPIKGFFAIECLGKNRIFVDGQRVEQGEVAMLESGSTLKMNAYNLVFLLPEDAKSTTMELSTPASVPSSSLSSAVVKKKPINKVAAVVEKLEATPISILLDEFFEAIKTGQWERKHQMMGGAITLYACKDAARSKSIQRIAKSNEGVSRSEVMDWIASSKRYSKWVVQVLNKMEVKSYQANVTKCLWKAGYRRNAPVGRFVRWNLPSEAELGPGDLEEEDSDGENDNGKGQTKTQNQEEEDDEEEDEGNEQEGDEDEDEEGAEGEEPKEDDDDNEDDDDDDDEGGAHQEVLGNDNDMSDDDEDDEGDDAQINHGQEMGGKRLRLDYGAVAAKKLRLDEDEDEDDSD